MFYSLNYNNYYCDEYSYLRLLLRLLLTPAHAFHLLLAEAFAAFEPFASNFAETFAAFAEDFATDFEPLAAMCA